MIAARIRPTGSALLQQKKGVGRLAEPLDTHRRLIRNLRVAACIVGTGELSQ
jgi:hypothetical protein